MGYTQAARSHYPVRVLYSRYRALQPLITPQVHDVDVLNHHHLRDPDHIYPTVDEGCLRIDENKISLDNPIADRESPTTSRPNNLDPGRENLLLSAGSGGANSMVVDHAPVQAYWLYSLSFVFRHVWGLTYRQGNFVAA